MPASKRGRPLFQEHDLRVARICKAHGKWEHEFYALPDDAQERLLALDMRREQRLGEWLKQMQKAEYIDAGAYIAALLETL